MHTYLYCYSPCITNDETDLCDTGINVSRLSQTHMCCSLTMHLDQFALVITKYENITSSLNNLWTPIHGTQTKAPLYQSDSSNATIIYIWIHFNTETNRKKSFNKQAVHMPVVLWRFPFSDLRSVSVGFFIKTAVPVRFFRSRF